jgi:hypothetical protein
MTPRQAPGRHMTARVTAWVVLLGGFYWSLFARMLPFMQAGTHGLLRVLITLSLLLLGVFAPVAAWRLLWPTRAPADPHDDDQAAPR